MNSYKTIDRFAEGEITEKRSRFIAVAYPVENEQQAADIITSVKKKHFSAKHNVFAYRLKSGEERYSEDGEPQGTAAAPILDLLRSLDLSDCLVVVTRYFGGILLGTGGLVRAYTSAAKAALDKSGTKEYVLHTVNKITFEYSLYGRVEGIVSSFGGSIIDSDFADEVCIFAAIKKDMSEPFCKKIIDSTNGTATVESVREIFK
ncbi:MAG: YigZ family protein [Clostridia bacterium]|nr:YigZ family protein [Clostridia bacterium]